MRPLLRPSFLYLLPYGLRRAVYAGLKRAKFDRLQQKRHAVFDGEYSYQPYDRYQCIFVHIPKAAGMSVCRSLFGNLAGGHATLADYQIIFAQADFERYFKFTFVRNPWDRVLSAYNFLKQGGATEFDRQWAPNIARYETFDDFIRHGLHTPLMRRKLHFRPQHSFLTVPYNARARVDFLGFFENIERDFEFVKSRLKLDHDPVLRHENRTPGEKGTDYREFYSDETRDIVQRFYRRDIELFGYSFDNSSLPRQIAQRDRN